MKSIIGNKYLLFFSRSILSFIFIYSAFEKLNDLSAFSQSIANYKLLPEFLINIFAIILPWIELAAGLLLLFGISVKENAFIINFLLLIFIAAIGISLIRGLNIDCGCFGTQGGTKIGITKLAENILLFLLGLQLIFFDSKFLTLQSQNKFYQKEETQVL